MDPTSPRDEHLQRILDRMVTAGWVLSFTLPPVGPSSVTWSRGGNEKAILLRSVAKAYKLGLGPEVVAEFDEMVHRDVADGPQPAEPMSPTLARFWCESLAELALPRDPFTLFALVELILDHGPNRPRV